MSLKALHEDIMKISICHNIKIDGALNIFFLVTTLQNNLYDTFICTKYTISLTIQIKWDFNKLVLFLSQQPEECKLNI